MFFHKFVLKLYLLDLFYEKEYYLYIGFFYCVGFYGSHVLLTQPVIWPELVCR